MTALLEVERLTKFFPLGGHSTLARMVQVKLRRHSGADGTPEPALLHAVDDVSISVEAGESTVYGRSFHSRPLAASRPPAGSWSVDAGG